MHNLEDNTNLPCLEDVKRVKPSLFLHSVGTSISKVEPN